MARYIDLDRLLKGLEDEIKDKNPDDLAYIVFKLFIGRLSTEPTADVVPKSEVERLTINMNAYGLTAKRLAEENESLEIELENMRRNLGDAREGWNDAECEVERLKEDVERLRGRFLRRLRGYSMERNTFLIHFTK